MDSPVALSRIEYKYYERMMAEHTAEMTSDDWKYAAYNYWLLGRRDECFRCLIRAEELHGQEPESSDEEAFAPPSFADVVCSDSRLLQSLGARKEELDYLYDAYHRTKRQLILPSSISGA